MIGSAPSTIYSFSGFRLDPPGRKVTAPDGRPLTISARAFDTLVYLVAHAGEAVDRSTLTDAVWPGRIVEENNLTQAIAVLRRVLGEEHIVTLAGRGYQFVTPVRSVDPSVVEPFGAQDAEAANAYPDPPPGGPGLATTRAPRAPAGPVLLGTAALVAAVAVATAMWFSSDSDRVGAATSAIEDAPTLPNSIAVLPFETLSTSEEDAYFTAGLHDEIVNQLGRLSGLNVISRTTVLRYRERTQPITAVARELGVQSVMEGTVRRSGNRVRVAVQMVDAQTEALLWSESYERELNDVFAIQSSVATNVARALEVQVSVAERRRLVRPAPTASQRAYELYLAARGMATGPATEPTFSAVLERLDQAVGIDPKFAAAWRAKSAAHAVLVPVLARDLDEHKAAALDAAQRALLLDPDSPDSHAFFAFANLMQGRWMTAREAMQRASSLGADIAASPGYAIMQMAIGDFAGARETLTANLRLDPLNHVSAGLSLVTHQLTGNIEARHAAYERGETLFGDWFGDPIEILLRLGERDVEYLRQATRPTGPLGAVLETARPHLESPELGLGAIRALHEDDAAYGSPVGLLYIGAWAAYFGDSALALAMVRESVTLSPSQTWVLWLPLFSEVRREPGFKDLVVDLGLVDYWHAYGWPSLCRLENGSGDDFECI